MKTWDLNSGAAKLELAMETLHRAWSDAAEHWNDDASRKFQEQCLAPLEPKYRKALDAVHRLAEILSRAERACSDTGE